MAVNAFGYNLTSHFLELSLVANPDDTTPHPYIYRLTHKPTNKHYVGVRFANKLPAPLDLGIHYFTSNPDIKIDLRKNPTDYSMEYICFDCDDAAIQAEYDTLQLIKEADHKDRFLNTNYSARAVKPTPERTASNIATLAVINNCPKLTAKRINACKSQRARRRSSESQKLRYALEPDSLKQARQKQLAAISQKGVEARRAKQDEAKLEKIFDELYLDDTLFYDCRLTA